MHCRAGYIGNNKGETLSRRGRRGAYACSISIQLSLCPFYDSYLMPVSPPPLPRHRPRRHPRRNRLRSWRTFTIPYLFRNLTCTPSLPSPPPVLVCYRAYRNSLAPLLNVPRKVLPPVHARSTKIYRHTCERPTSAIMFAPSR